MSDPALALVEGWFAAKGWTPFAFQREAWAAFAAGRSGLIHSDTGTGKTYAAYLGPLLEGLSDALAAGVALKPTESRPKRGGPPPEPIRVLWLTPLRALAADTQQALEAPVRALGLPWEVGSRTADTPASRRARQLERLPTVLVTTPESLCLLLSRPESRGWFSSLRAVVADEWHELLAGKRGTQAELALARLRRWNPHLRSWGVSATLGNLPTALRALVGTGGDGVTVRGLAGKRVAIDSVIPKRIERFPWAGHLGLTLLPEVVAAVEAGRSALVFTNTRAQTETWYQALLEARPGWAGEVALHHGSLDRKVRDWVEGGLRDGKLRCVVCTSSLDLGVDFSPVDRVLQVGSPKGVARLLQRAGRSGHQPGAESRVTFVPTNVMEFLEVAAARRAAAAGRVEGRVPLEKPLDVLAQHVVTLACAGPIDAADTLAEVRSAYSYRDLTDEEWGWVLDFAHRGGDSLRAYPEFARVARLDDGTYAVTDQRVAKRHRMSLGTIVGDAAIRVRFLRGGDLGTIEESFVSRLKKGDRFVFAGKALEFVKLWDNVAYVRKAKRATGLIPRWSGGRLPLSGELAAGVREQLGRAARGEWDASPELAALRPVLELQAKWSAIPAPGQFLIERLESREGWHLFAYPFAGRLVHEGLAAVWAYRLSRLTPITFTIAVNDFGLELLSPTPGPFEPARLGELLDDTDLTADILDSLNATEMAKRAFKEIARVAGLVSPGMPGANKSAKHLQASSNLFFQVFSEHDPDNLLLRQARREVLERQLEYDRLRETLARLRAAEPVVREIDRPTPLGFALLVDRMRASLSSEKLADRIKRMTQQLERAAGS